MWHKITEAIFLLKISENTSEIRCILYFSLLYKFKCQQCFRKRWEYYNQGESGSGLVEKQ